MNRRDFLRRAGATVAAAAAAPVVAALPAAGSVELSTLADGYFEVQDISGQLSFYVQEGADKYGAPCWRQIGDPTRYREALIEMFTRENEILKNISFSDAAKAS